MDIADHLGYLDADGEALVAAADTAGFDAAVPGCPDWTVRDLLMHIGGVHRWAADHVANARQGFDSEAGAAVGTGPADAELSDWCNAGRAELLHALRGAPSDVDCSTFVPWTSPLEFWARRQAHETAIHRADAEAAGGTTPVFDPAFALDGIAEILEVFASRRKGFEPATLLLAPTASPATHLTLTDSGAQLGDPADTADVTVSGTPSDIYLWLWQRPAAVSFEGASEVAERWKKLRVRWT
jgi:uncharacterized protein (TIGR03083 family)